MRQLSETLPDRAQRAPELRRQGREPGEKAEYRSRESYRESCRGFSSSFQLSTDQHMHVWKPAEARGLEGAFS